jgi:hypothetical protein
VIYVDAGNSKKSTSVTMEARIDYLKAKIIEKTK